MVLPLRRFPCFIQRCLYGRVVSQFCSRGRATSLRLGFLLSLVQSCQQCGYCTHIRQPLIEWAEVGPAAAPAIDIAWRSHFGPKAAANNSPAKANAPQIIAAETNGLPILMMATTI